MTRMWMLIWSALTLMVNGQPRIGQLHQTTPEPMLLPECQGTSTWQCCINFIWPIIMHNEPPGYRYGSGKIAPHNFVSMGVVEIKKDPGSRWKFDCNSISYRENRTDKVDRVGPFYMDCDIGQFALVERHGGYTNVVCMPPKDMPKGNDAWLAIRDLVRTEEGLARVRFLYETMMESVERRAIMQGHFHRSFNRNARNARSNEEDYERLMELEREVERRMAVDQARATQAQEGVTRAIRENQQWTRLDGFDSD